MVDWALNWGAQIVVGVGIIIAFVLAFGTVLRWHLKASEREQAAFWREAQARDRARYEAEQSWVDGGVWPLTHYDLYATDWEMVEDLARLKAMGFDIEWQEHTAGGVAVTYSLTSAYKRRVPTEDAY